MKFCSLLFFLFFFALAVSAEIPVMAVPGTIEVPGNGFQSMAFLAKLEGVTWENVSFSCEGFPVENPPDFDKDSRIFYWRPEPGQAGYHNFKIIARDASGNRLEKEVTVRVFDATSPEALPASWKDMKKEEKYLNGRGYFPATNLMELAIAALPEY